VRRATILRVETGMANPVSFIGGGNMARSLIGGLIARGRDAATISVSEPDPQRRQALGAELGIAACASNLEAAARGSIWVLAVKPQVLRAVCAELRATAEQQRPLVVSIAAGVRIDALARWLGAGARVVRAMPNTPALIGAGITALVAAADVDTDSRAQAQAILQPAGETLWLAREDDLDAVTAVSGSGPAYFFALMEAMQNAAISQGLDPDTAAHLVRATALGAARMAAEGDESPRVLRERVTSPKGTTAAALAVFDSQGFAALIDAAITAATRRGAEIAQEMARD